MNFTRTGQWHETSECGGYTTAASRHGDRFLYSAFRVITGQPGQCLGAFGTAEEAREACRNAASQTTETSFPDTGSER